MEIDFKGAALAPMAGVTDSTMRRLCARFGAVFTVSEMVSAKALTMGDRKTFALLRGRTPDNVPYGVQLFGHEPDVMAGAAGRIDGEDFDFLDLNMGCPAPKISGHGDGSGLLKNPPLAGDIAKAVVKASRRPVSAKLRIGWDEKCMTGREVAMRCEDAGVAFLVVHARTKVEMCTPGVHVDAVADIKRSVKIPVLYNGDVDSAASALEAIKESGCDGVAIGRAAIGNPFLFGEVRAALHGEALPAPPTLRQRFELLDEQVRGMCDEKGEGRGMREARKVAAGYMHGLNGAAQLRRAAVALTYYTDLAQLVELAYYLNG